MLTPSRLATQALSATARLASIMEGSAPGLLKLVEALGYLVQPEIQVHQVSYTIGLPQVLLVREIGCIGQSHRLYRSRTYRGLHRRSLLFKRSRHSGTLIRLRLQWY